jgi:hypothetical protein
MSLYAFDEKNEEWIVSDRFVYNERIGIRGSNFISQQFFTVYLSDQQADEGDKIDIQIKAYHEIGIVSTGNSTGFNIQFLIPKLLDDGEHVHQIEDGKYYIYVAYPDSGEVLSKLAFNLVDRKTILYRHRDDNGSVWEQTDRAQIGESVEIYGYGFEPDRKYDIYLSSTAGIVGDEIDDKITTYYSIGQVVIDLNLSFRISFIIPKELDDGAYKKTIKYGTYFIYLVPSASDKIDALAKLTILEGEIKVKPEKGFIGDWVTLDGDGFNNRESLVVYFSNSIAKVGEYIEYRIGAYELAGFLLVDSL